MNWTKEPWRKFYTRRTDEDLLLSWEARAVWHEMLRTFDAYGNIKTRRGVQGLAALIGIPRDVVERALAELEEAGRVQRKDEGFFAPNFWEAQTAKTAGSTRTQMHRERIPPNESVTRSDAMKPDVTSSDSVKPDVTIRERERKIRERERACARDGFSRRRVAEDPNLIMIFDGEEYIRTVRIDPSTGSESEVEP